MADPWWFRGARFTKQVERLDASERRDVLTAVARDTRWYRRVAVAVFVCAALGAIAVLVHDGVYATGSGDAWRHEFTLFFGVITLVWVIMSERIDLVTAVASGRTRRALRTSTRALPAARTSRCVARVDDTARSIGRPTPCMTRR